MVHPECRRDVVFAADEAGSTKRGYSDCGIYALSPEEPLCPNMAKITPAKLYRTLAALDEGKPTGRVSVDESIAAGARLALERMLECE